MFLIRMVNRIVLFGFWATVGVWGYVTFVSGKNIPVLAAIKPMAEVQKASDKEEDFRKFLNTDESLPSLVAATKAAMHDPTSFKHFSTIIIFPDGEPIVQMYFEGKSLIGTTARNWVQARCDSNGKVVAILRQGTYDL